MRLSTWRPFEANRLLLLDVRRRLVADVHAETHDQAAVVGEIAVDVDDHEDGQQDHHHQENDQAAAQAGR